MEVLLYQAIIFSTIFLTGVIFPNYLLIVAIAWSLLTIVNLFFPPLIIVQLINIFASYKLAKWIRPHRETTTQIPRTEPAVKRFEDKSVNHCQVERKNARDSERYWQDKATYVAPTSVFTGFGVPIIHIPKVPLKVISQATNFLQGLSEGNQIPILTSDHHGLLIELLLSAKSEVIIFSGWVSARVVTDDFIQLLKYKRFHGVEIFIGYGFESHSGVHEATDSAIAAVERLRQLSGICWISRPINGSDSMTVSLASNRLTIKKFATHKKLLIIDQQYLVFGSHNWLSTHSGRNEERSILLSSSRLGISEGEQALKSFHEKERRSNL